MSSSSDSVPDLDLAKVAKRASIVLLVPAVLGVVLGTLGWMVTGSVAVIEGPYGIILLGVLALAFAIQPFMIDHLMRSNVGNVRVRRATVEQAFVMTPLLSSCTTIFFGIAGALVTGEKLAVVVFVAIGVISGAIYAQRLPAWQQMLEYREARQSGTGRREWRKAKRSKRRAR